MCSSIFFHSHSIIIHFFDNLQKVNEKDIA